MAYADYIHCEICDSKVLYDADLDYESPNFGKLKALCKECNEKFEIKIVPVAISED